jgi:uncharacterized membrane protein
MSGGKAWLVLTGCFVMFFLFSTGFMFAITGDVPISYILGGSRMNKVDFYDTVTQELDPPCAVWLSRNAAPSAKIYGDAPSDQEVLTSFGAFPLERLIRLDNTMTLDRANYVYLRYLNVNYGLMENRGGYVWNITSIAPQLSNMNRLYSNGGCIVDNGPYR